MDSTERDGMEALTAGIESVVLGQPDLVRHLAITLLAGGHALIEGVPGTAKTLAVRALGRALDLRFGRVQFTPDLMPTDLLGVNVLDPRTATFEFRPGPVFTDLLLADEINRAPAKTQAALLEAMQERQVTVDGETRRMSPAFTVLATQNPVEFEGTYPLPEAQLDRFLLKIRVGYPGEESEAAILDRYVDGFDAERTETFPATVAVGAGSLAAMKRQVAAVHVEPPVRRYITRIVRATRDHPTFSLGASPRGGVALFLATRAEAVLAGRDFATPDDVKALAIPVLRHRVMLTPEAEVEGRGADEWLLDVLESVEAPRDR
ncbi:MAG TPA: MoxR family ATPase [Longimicrobiales bacterium]|nr:MoxR family ATPase [Longimicrobiales bacterium]